jgi:uncharacterized protein YrzB (UPF0473 family)
MVKLKSEAKHRTAGLCPREDMPMDQNEKMEKDVISLLDEDGKEHEFEIVDALELEDRQYMALVPLYSEEEAQDALEDSGELVILRVSDEEDEDGEQYLDVIEDEDEYNRVADLFMERLEEYFDFEDGEEE